MVIFPLAPDQIIAQMWSNGARGGIARKPLEIQVWFQKATNWKWHMGYQMVTWWRHVTLKRQTR